MLKPCIARKDSNKIITLLHETKCVLKEKLPQAFMQIECMG